MASALITVKNKGSNRQLPIRRDGTGLHLSPFELETADASDIGADFFRLRDMGRIEFSNFGNFDLQSSRDWLEKMSLALVPSDTLYFDSAYNYTYTGQVTGGYSSDRQTIDPVPIALNGESYPQSGVVASFTGYIKEAYLPEDLTGYFIQASLFTDDTYPQFQITPNPDGSFAFDTNAFAGEWRFQLMSSALTAVGDPLKETPDPLPYENLKIAFYLVTDADYLIEVFNANESNRFTINKPNAGSVKLQLFDSDTSEILEEVNLTFGLIRSYELFEGDIGFGTNFQSRAYLYDNALSLLVYTFDNNAAKAETLANAIVETQMEDGQFPFSAPFTAPTAYDPYIRNGGSAWTVYSLIKYLEKFPSASNAAAIETATIAAINALLSYKGDAGYGAGLIRGGKGRYVGDIFEPDYTIPWFSTEHNIDMWFVFKAASNVIGDDGAVDYQAEADSLKAAMLRALWRGDRFYQGANDAGPDTAGALDIYSWGAMLLNAWGDTAKVEASRVYIDLYETRNGIAVGWSPYSAKDGYPGAAEVVWFEGSFGVTMMQRKLGEFPEYEFNLLGAATEDGAYRYSAQRDEIYEISTYPSVASTTWGILSYEYSDKLWDEIDD